MNRERKKGYTQIKIQMLTGIEQSDYSKIEAGIRMPTVEQVRCLAMVLNTSMDYIFCLTDDSVPYPRSTT